MTDLVTTHDACLDEMKARTAALQERMRDQGVDLCVFTDEDAISYYAGFWGYLGLEWGRPTVLMVPSDGEPDLITPLMESDMARAMTWIANVHPWEDGRNREWLGTFRNLLPRRSATIGVERFKSSRGMLEGLRSVRARHKVVDISPVVMEQRLIKSPLEIAIMKEAGQVAIAMVEGGRDAIKEGVPEYELALAVLQAGTRRAADFLTDEGRDQFLSPTISNLQVLQSGEHTSMVHRRSTKKPLAKGDPVYFCFCGMVNFKQYKLGFDRQFWVGEAPEEQMATYEVTLAAQQAALDAIKPGVKAEDVAAAANAVYADAGFEPGYRTGRAVGMSYLEAPELKQGDKTILAEGMTFAVDGGITVAAQEARDAVAAVEAVEGVAAVEAVEADPDNGIEAVEAVEGVEAVAAVEAQDARAASAGYGARVGDSIVVTADGFEFLTPFEKRDQVVG